MKTRKVLAFVLAAAMLLAAIPAVFAAETPTITVGQISITSGETSSNVPVNVSGFSEIPVTGLKLEFEVASGLSINSATLSSAATNAGLTADVSGIANGIVTLLPDNSHIATGVKIPDGELLTLGVAVDTNATGTLSITLSDNQENYQYYSNPAIYETGSIGNVAVEAGSITISDGSDEPADGYTATLSTSAVNNEVLSEGKLNVNVKVSHNSDTTFNAGEIKLSYDVSKLNPDATALQAMVDAGTLSGYKIDNGVLTIEDFGADKTMPYTYSIPFAAAEVDVETTGTVTLTEAAFIHKDQADESDLIDATKSPESLSVTIKVPMVTVTMTNSADPTETTTVQTQKGQDYTFAPTDTNNYTYEVSATVNGVSVEVTDNGNGTFTIAASAVTDNIALTYTKTAKSYSITWNGEGAADIDNKPTTATYGENLSVILPDDKEPNGAEDGWTYGISATIGGASVGSYDSTTRTLTIAGTDITGAITITVTKETVTSDDVTVTVSGDSDLSIEGATGNTTTVKSGESVTLVLNAETGYIYTVTDGNGNEVTFTDGKYTFTATESMQFTVNKTLDVSSVAVYEYVTMNGVGSAWLVTFKGALTDKIPTYGGTPMLWSEKYDAYCYLVIDSALNPDTAKANVGAQFGTATNVNYGMDINGTGVIDAADAQLIWNMYNAEYANFAAVTMAQFLAADQNASSNSSTWKLTVEDAQVIIDAILNPTAN